MVREAPESNHCPYKTLFRSARRVERGAAPVVDPVRRRLGQGRRPAWAGSRVGGGPVTRGRLDRRRLDAFANASVGRHVNEIGRAHV